MTKKMILAKKKVILLYSSQDNGLYKIRKLISIFKKAGINVLCKELADTSTIYPKDFQKVDSVLLIFSPDSKRIVQGGITVIDNGNIPLYSYIVKKGVSLIPFFLRIKRKHGYNVIAPEWLKSYSPNYYDPNDENQVNSTIAKVQRHSKILSMITHFIIKNLWKIIVGICILLGGIWAAIQIFNYTFSNGKESAKITQPFFCNFHHRSFHRFGFTS